MKVSDGAIRHLVTQDGPDAAPVWSPDGSKIAFETSMAKPFYFYTNHAIAVIPSAGGPIDNLSTAFDEDPSIVRWTAAGIFFSASQRTSSFLFSIDPATRAVKKFAPSESWMGAGFSLTPDAQWMACQASDPSTLHARLIDVDPLATALHVDAPGPGLERRHHVRFE